MAQCLRVVGFLALLGSGADNVGSIAISAAVAAVAATGLLMMGEPIIKK